MTHVPACAVQVPILLSSAAFVAASLIELALVSLGGAYLGFLYGSSVGEMPTLAAAFMLAAYICICWSCM